MTVLTDAELAAAAGTGPEVIGQLQDLGLLDRPVAGGHTLSSVARVRLILGFAASGVSLESLAEGVRAGALELDFIDELVPSPVLLRAETYEEVAERLDVPETTDAALRTLLGTIGAAGSDPMRSDDVEVYELLGTARSLGASDEEIMAVVRVVATAMRTVVRAYRDFIDEVLVGPTIAAGATSGEALAVTSVARREFRRMGAELAQLLMGRFMDEAVFQNVAALGEHALAEAGIVPRTRRAVPGIAFVDLSGYTALAADRGDDVAARMATRFAAFVDETSAVRGGRLVKLLGDGAMLVFDEAAEAVRWAVELVSRRRPPDMPAFHLGLDAGTFVRRDDDYFGSVVNVASRAADWAGPDQVVVTARMAERAAEIDQVHFESLGAIELKNVAAPIELFRAQARA